MSPDGFDYYRGVCLCEHSEITWSSERNFLTVFYSLRVTERDHGKKFIIEIQPNNINKSI